LELQASESKNGITQVGPKVAALYLRDLVMLFNLSDSVKDDSAFCLQPIDTWVRKLARKVGIVDEHADDPSIQRAIVKACAENGIPAFRFNQGAWYLGYNALALLLALPDPVFELMNKTLAEKSELARS
jgi:hypothetical protein